jgi:DNA gyrase inhibitor GyrI
MKGKNKMILGGLGALVIATAILWGPIVSDVEQAAYQVAESADDIEIRIYDPMIIAEVSIRGPRKDAINKGFGMLAGYIFGENQSNAEVSMTAPVTQQQENKIPMTAPVTQQREGDAWQVRFVMPRQYDMDSLPKPNNPEISIKKIPAMRQAVIRFSGIADDDKLKEKTEELMKFIRSNNLEPASQPIYAFFNPPWTLPLLRRNEVMIPLHHANP